MNNFKFTDDSKSIDFDSKLYLNRKGLIGGVGKRPADNENYTELKLFNCLENPFDFLTTAIHYGLQQFRERFRILPNQLDILVSPDLVQILQGSEVTIFKQKN